MRLDRLITIAGLASRPEFHSAEGVALFPEATTRGWINANLDGFRDQVVVMLGGKVMVDIDALHRWIEGRRGKRATPRAVTRVRYPRSRRPAQTLAEWEAGLASPAAGRR